MSRFVFLFAFLIVLPSVAYCDPDKPGWEKCDLFDGTPAVRIQGCTKALKISKSSDDKVMAYSWRSHAYADAKRYDEAIKDINMAYGISNSINEIEDRAKIYRQMGRYDLAITDYDFVISHSVNVSYGSLVRRAEVHELAGHIPEAIVGYEAAIKRGGTLDSIIDEARANVARLKAKQRAG